MKRAALLAAAVVGAGCHAGSAVCPADTTCDQPPPATLQLAAELVPPDSSEFVAQEAASVIFDGAGVATLVLAPTVRLEGVVLGQNGEAIAAQVVVSRPSLIPGSPDVVVQGGTSTMKSPAGIDGLAPGHFAMRVPALEGVPVTIAVSPLPPDDATWPPATFALAPGADLSAIVLCLGGQASGGACAPAAAALATITGRVADAGGGGLAGTRVVAADVNTGEPRSSTALTGADGTFSLHLSPDVHPDDLVRIVASPEADGAQPTLQRTVAASGSGASCSAPTDCRSGLECAGDAPRQCAAVLRMPSLPPAVSVALPVGGAGPDGKPMALAGARVDFAGDLSAPGEGTEAHLEASVLSDGQGLTVAELIPGDAMGPRTYAVTVTPPANSMFARVAATVEVGAAARLDGISLGLRPRLLGQLVAPSGAPVGGAVITAQPAAAALHLGVEDAVDLTAPMTVTDGDGRFSMSVDRGSYDIELVPPTGQPLARWSIDNREVDGSDVDLRTVPLPRGVLTHVRVQRPDGQPAPGVEVRIWALAWADSCPGGEGTCPLPPRLRGLGLTGADGVAPLLLPAP